MCSLPFAAVEPERAVCGLHCAVFLPVVHFPVKTVDNGQQLWQRLWTSDLKIDAGQICCHIVPVPTFSSFFGPPTAEAMVPFGPFLLRQLGPKCLSQQPGRSKTIIS